MATTRHTLISPSLEEIAKALGSELHKNYSTSSAIVADCPDLRKAPFHVAFEGLSGSEVAADIGGQGNLYPQPHPEKQYSLLECARIMELSPDKGAILGAGAGPALVHGMPSELAPHLSWQSGFDQANNYTRSARLEMNPQGRSIVGCPESKSHECAMMMNLFGSRGLPGPVVKVTAKGRIGDIASFTDCLRHALRAYFGEDYQICLGGVFMMKRGKAKYHVMPPFPPQHELPFKSEEALNNWLSYHTFEGPMTCLTIFHSADPQRLGVRLEHTHCFSNSRPEGGHYHYDLPSEGPSDEVEYEGYFNTAKTYFQIDVSKVEE